MQQSEGKNRISGNLVATQTITHVQNLEYPNLGFRRGCDAAAAPRSVTGHSLGSRIPTEFCSSGSPMKEAVGAPTVNRNKRHEAG